MNKFGIIIIALMAAFSANALNTAQQADSAYNKEDYKQAIELYTEALGQTGRNANIYFNLGNAWYREGNIGQAVINYERALRVDPTFDEARTNLDFVRSKLEDKPEDNISLLQRSHSQVVKSMTANGWAWTALVAFLFVLGFTATYVFSSNVTLRKTGFFGGIVMLVITIYFVIVAYDATKRIDDNSQAIVTVPSTLLNSVPRQPKQTDKVVPLHEGTKVEIIDSVATPDDPVSPRWYNVRVNGSSSAWLRATDVTRI